MDTALQGRLPFTAGPRRQPGPAAALIRHHAPPRQQQPQPSTSGRPAEPSAQRDAAGAFAASRRYGHVVRVAAEATTAADLGHPSLQDCSLDNLLNTQGFIDPEVPEGTEASVFAIFDANKKLQYIGFSKDFRNSLRTVFGRRPDKVYFHKATHLPQLDQKEMIALRESWFAEVGGPPIGNKLAMERAQWERPVDGGAISARGKLEAAKSQVQTQLAAIRTRGAVEEFVPNPELLEQGQVDFLPAAALDREAMDLKKEAIAKIQAMTRTVSTVVDNAPRDFKLFFQRTIKTNGGFMFDVLVTFDERETKHRVICGAEFYESMGIEAETVIERVFSFLLMKKIPRHTEGIMLSNEFPVNYFSVSEVEQMWSGDFQDMFKEGKLPGEGSFWRFNKIHDYGSAPAEDGDFNTWSEPGSRKTTWIDS